MNFETPSALPAEPASSTLWLTTFADLCALLLSFFVLLYATSPLDTGRWHPEVTTPLAVAGQDDNTPPPPEPPQSSIPVDRSAEAINGYVFHILQQRIEAETALAGTRLNQGPRGLSIIPPRTSDRNRDGEATFDEPVMAALVRVLTNISGTLCLVVPGSGATTGRGDSPLAGALDRGIAIGAALVKAGYPVMPPVIARSQTRERAAKRAAPPQNVPSNGVNSGANTNDLASAVEFVILASEASWK